MFLLVVSLRKQHGQQWTDLQTRSILIISHPTKAFQQLGAKGIVKEEKWIWKKKKKKLTIIETHIRNLIKKRETMMGQIIILE